MKADRTVVLATTDFRPMPGGVADYLHNVAQSLSPVADVTVMTTVAVNGSRWDHAYRLRPLAPLPERRLGERVGDTVSVVRRAHTGAYFRALRGYGGRLILDLPAAPDGSRRVLLGIWDTATHFWCEACRRADVPYYLFAYGKELLLPLYGRLPEWRRRDFAGAARVIACSRSTAELAQRLFELPAAPVAVSPAAGPRPADTAVRDRAAQLRHELACPPETTGPIVFSIGRLVARKGFDLVLRSVADLSARFPALQYVIGGEGPEHETLARLARNLGVARRVHFLGAVDDLTKWAAYELSDLFVMPNRSLDGTDWEGFGIVFAEAALAGRAAIGGRSGGAGDAIADGVTGLLVDPERPGHLTTAIERVLADRDLGSRLAASAGERARSEFSQRALAGRLGRALGWN